MARWARHVFAVAGVSFIHVPKAAGTSISAALYEGWVPHVTAAQMRIYDPDLWGALPSFTVVRNPWDRLLSAYRFARAGGGSDAHAIRIRNPELYQTPAFASFERFVEEWLGQQDLGRADMVFRPQAPFVCDVAGRLLVDHVARMEEMEALSAHLSDLLGRSVEVPRHNVTAGPGSYRDAYTPALRRRVEALYAQDIETFRYRF